MRKVLTVIFAFFVLIFGMQNLYAQDNAYKNNLLKIEIIKQDDTHYNIGIYTQKLYNEPVKVIQKSDNIYYFLLPETNNSVTSVPSVGDVTNVIVKSYPYAGQDVNNGYTKVALMTTKPVNFTTTLKVADGSISPRLDPLRLARLDNVFARYADKLAQNNIPSPLNQFRKVASAPKQRETTKIASAETNAKSLEEYQNKLNKEQAAKKAQTQTAVQKKPVVQAQPVKTQPKQTEVQKTAQHQTQIKPKADVKPVQTQKKEQVPVTQKIAQAKVENKPNAAPVTAKPQTRAESKPALKQEATKPQAQKTEAIKPLPVKEEKTETASLPETKPVSASVKPEANKEAKEFEKQLATTKPVDVEFNTAKNEENKNIEATIPEEKQIEAQIPNDADKNKKLLQLIAYVITFSVLFGAYKKAKNKRLFAARESVQTEQNESIKELLKRTQPKTAVEPEIQEQEDAENKETLEPIADAIEPVDEEEAEKIEAFNNYMDSIQNEDEEIEQPVAITPETADDAVINELYKPIETPVYKEYDEPASYNNESVEEQDSDDVATIVSSSKLTETRGLYLAKFEGSTSLVGYIQDDIYVLYNFGDVDLKETEIESNLAEENDANSLYIVKTGGKKLMVKSTPYDMSLEMVM